MQLPISTTRQPPSTSATCGQITSITRWQVAPGDSLWFGEVRLDPWKLHPRVPTIALSGLLMICKILRIPKR
ncbi:MAG: hypothetical protein ACT4NL_04160 [Pseudomarimonas sp.]